ncbi:L-rhamnose-binding lectin ELEL-1-like isoform X1 [Biomphalaria glabrata]|uniref:L-rhamnose-binding lectin ELEL-1-like isoform X1 n=1 Tax=Biomphalaria glabrata TaxID=6526 RepID=A0A9W3AGU6_BIOGL|nr:L-rhamnose-binding lectin ELEL-1-like isoform X1 [Biomphalaria glabrata]
MMFERLTRVLLTLLATLLLTSVDASNTPKKSWACEGMQVTITCDSGETINVLNAEYGYFDKVCDQEHPDIVCRITVTQRVAYICQGRLACTVEVGSSNFQNPCSQNLYKHLEIVYECKK